MMALESRQAFVEKYLGLVLEGVWEYLIIVELRGDHLGMCGGGLVHSGLLCCERRVGFPSADAWSQA